MHDHRITKTMNVADSGSVESFPPMLGETLHTLVLGTMPGLKSLQSQQYYAHPRNALWPILCAIATSSKPSYTVHRDLTYAQRCELISRAGFGLWDVLASCERPGSLDSSIVRSTESPNPVNTLITKHPELKTVVCNGRAAHTLFKRHVQPLIGIDAPRVLCLPSTSPAMASLSLEAKYAQWVGELQKLV